MRKYIITFTYKGIGFSAKVTVKNIAGKALTSVALIRCELDFLLAKNTLMFTKSTAGYALILCKKDNSSEILDWKIKNEYQEEAKVSRSAHAFSLS